MHVSRIPLDLNTQVTSDILTVLSSRYMVFDKKSIPIVAYNSKEIVKSSSVQSNIYATVMYKLQINKLNRILSMN